MNECVRACVCACVHSCLRVYHTAPQLRPPFLRPTFRKKEGGGHNNEDLRFLAVKPPPLPRIHVLCSAVEDETAEHFKMAEEEVGRLLTGARETLFREWLSQPKPHRDNKMLTAWNGERSGLRKVMRV